MSFSKRSLPVPAITKLPSLGEKIILPRDRKIQALEEQNRLLLELLEQSQAGKSVPDRETEERLARLERLEAWVAEQGWDDERRGWFRRKQKRKHNPPPPVVNVYNTPRDADEPAKPFWRIVAVLFILGVVAIAATTSGNAPSRRNNHSGLSAIRPGQDSAQRVENQKPDRP
jgi:hypothetical protein